MIGNYLIYLISSFLSSLTSTSLSVGMVRPIERSGPVFRTEGCTWEVCREARSGRRQRRMRAQGGRSGRGGLGAGEPAPCRPRSLRPNRPARASGPWPAGGAAGRALEPGSRKLRRGPSERTVGAGVPAGSAPSAPPPPPASFSPPALVQKGPHGCPRDERPRAPREHGRAPGRTVPGSHPGHGPASAEPRDQDR